MGNCLHNLPVDLLSLTQMAGLMVSLGDGESFRDGCHDEPCQAIKMFDPAASSDALPAVSARAEWPPNQ